MARDTDGRDYVAEFLAAGGTIQKIETGKRNDPAVIQKFWGGRPKKKAEEAEPAAAPKAKAKTRKPREKK
jgi:hypothetical protein